MIDGPTYFAWFVMALLFGVTVWLIVMIGSLPKKIALKRNHPQTDAINAASWIGLFLLGAGWPIAFIWAHMRSGPIGSDNLDVAADSSKISTIGDQERDQLNRRIEELEQQLKSQSSNKG
jgi:hypothetical protein